MAWGFGEGGWFDDSDTNIFEFLILKKFTIFFFGWGGSGKSIGRIRKNIKE